MNYIIDADGFLLGWTNEAESGSVSVSYAPIPASRARWTGAVWLDDASRDVATERKKLVDAAWSKADALALSGADNNSRSRYLAWMITGSEAKKAKIQAVQDWMDAIWTAYAIYKANPVGEFSPPTDPCPYDFWQIANTP